LRGASARGPCTSSSSRPGAPSTASATPSGRARPRCLGRSPSRASAP
jgi:hypothetical protein